jgi:hypothetical protein
MSKYTFLALLLLSACQFSGTLTPGAPSPSPSGSPAAAAPSAAPTPANNDAPIVNSANANPRVIGSAKDVITFNIDAFSPIGSALEYTWTSTKGFMSTNKGASAQWYPIGADGTAEAGPVVISCIITDTKRNQKKIDFNLLILPGGGAQVGSQSES